jgi:hypothetical protein
MRSIRRLTVLAALGVAATGCAGSSLQDDPVGGSTQQERRTIRLKPGHYTFHLGGRVRAGDTIVCVAARGTLAGGGVVPKTGGGVGSSTGFSVLALTSGMVKVTCPVHPGNA